MMIGGPKEAVQRLDPIFKTLAPGRGDMPRTPGREKLAARHLVRLKMDTFTVALLAPGTSSRWCTTASNTESCRPMPRDSIFSRTRPAKTLPEIIRYDLNLPDIAEVWRRGSVISSWLLDLTAMALIENPNLSEYSGYRARLG